MRPTLNRSFFKGMWNLTRTYWHSEEKWRARSLLTAIVLLNLAVVYMLVLLNKWNNRFYNSLQDYDIDRFWSLVGEFSLLAAVYIIIAVYAMYLQQMLEINWRRWLTGRYLRTWLHNQTYYRLQLLDNSSDNPDQRISEDLNLFTTLTLDLSVGLLRTTVTLASFAVILWNLSGELVLPLGGHQVAIPGYLVWVSFIYAVLGTWLTVKIGRPLIALNYHQQRYEADFRFSLIRLRENSESIAFYGGERQEEINFSKRFKKVFDNFWTIMLRRKKLTWFTSGYSQIAIIFPILVVAPRYFGGQLALGGLMQTVTAFDKVREGFSFFISSYTSLAEWQAVVNRLLGFDANVAQVNAQAGNEGVKIVDTADSELQVSGLDVALPNGVRLLKQLELRLAAGDSLLITGQSGCGKSTLMRTMAGIWPFGQGTIRRPAGQSMLFLPQKPYLPQGTLRDALLYPYGGGLISDSRIKEIMAICRLSEFTGKLDMADNWSHILSLGEQQRIAFARVMLQQPQWLFLDEATSALDESTERWLYRQLKEQLATTAIISIGHRNTLTGYHKMKLSLDGDGKWSLLQL
ncbi:ABC transporter ATP-binding protein/permease|uniref:Putative ATP-binding cassette transporter n=1 Tax=Dendrosporobacter quercicolus TaxID=146817 RepID=A0A1G9QEF4_9FIRM|nr:ABC transporter ATP-binding protein/permease [Dendrosporobacter quercicolus]NSL48218.1 ABC transporter ATP-binding protein/permease [Dendrosporobacter quercicolus DSM 1736]SDM09474.1 putative ATP-binding cassette transporter [Dendrosporobacter quercicolus]